MDFPARHDRSTVLLTGGTGLVGGLLLARLLECEIPVAVLVRGNRRQSAVMRVEAIVRRLEERCKRLFVRPVVLEGDLCQPGSGLSIADRRWVALHCGSLIHSAASLLFSPASEHPDNEPYRTNIDGTRNLLELMTSVQITEWHYVSTAYVAGLRSGMILEQESNVGQEFGNDYERSKALTEQMLTQSAAIKSLTVYRPSIVVDLHPTSIKRSEQTINTAFSVFHTLSKQFGLPERGEWIQRLGFDGEERKNIVTADWVSTMIAQIYRRPALHGATYHLTSPNGTPASFLEDSFRAAVQSSGVKIPPQSLDAFALIDKQATPFFAAFKPYFKDDPKFDRTHTIQAMQACGESDVLEMTIEHLRDFCLRESGPAHPVLTTMDPPILSEMASQGLRRSGEVVHEAEPRDTLIGLELCGSGGGQWLIEESMNGVRVHAAPTSSAPVRWIAAVATMNQLMVGRLSVNSALDAGLLMVEFDPEFVASTSPAARPTSQKLIAQFSSLVAAIQQHCLHQRLRTSEVAHVG